MVTSRTSRSLSSSLAGLLVAAALMSPGCRSSHFNSAPDAAVPEDARVALDGQAPPTDFGAACEAASDCVTPGLVCARPLGSSQPGICTVVGCREPGCPWGATCLELGLPDLDSLCVGAGGSGGECASRCGTALRCSLDPVCFELGCCGRQSCPPHCADLSAGDCELDGRCPEACCP